MNEPLEPLYSIQDVVDAYGLSARWLADQCRANKIEHVVLARQRKFTRSQVDAILARHTVTPQLTDAERSTARLRRIASGTDRRRRRT
ncbi:MAG: hypothetical protein ACRD0P_20880 [Stackebrandtia sp.]